MVVIWIALFLGIAKFETSLSTCSSHSFHVNDAVKNRALDDRIFMTAVIQEFHHECFSKCVDNCRCLSFNVCGKQCQLNTNAKDMRRNLNSMKVKQGCSYYDLRRSKSTGHPVCCSMSNPCLNGGSCTTSSQNSQRRFRCLCRKGFYGELCETYQPTSCASFLPQDVKPLSGEYTILDAGGTPYLVYCDFDSEPGFAWTLLISFTRNNGATISTKGLLQDFPINENTPNWENYRLSLARMNTLRDQSSHWRATCAYETYGVDYQDYIRVNLSVVNFAAYYFNGYNGPTACKTIEYMNILGSQCNNCNFALYSQAGSMPLLSLRNSKTWSYCTFDLSQKNHLCGSASAELFVVTGCLDTRFRCHKTESSTTQNWFGSSPLISV